MNFKSLYKTALWAVLSVAPLTAGAVLPQGTVFMGIDAAASTPKVYFSINASGRNLAELSVEFFNNELELVPIAEIDLLPLLSHNGEAVNEVLGLEVPGATSQSIFRFRHRYDDEAEATVSAYSNGTNDIVYWTDCMQVVKASGSSQYLAVYNTSYTGLNEGKLQIGSQAYANGISVPAAGGWANFKNTNLTDLANFVRFKADFGFQYSQAAGSNDFLIAQDPDNVRIFTGKSTQNIQKFDLPISSEVAAYGRLNNNKVMTFWASPGKEVTLGAPRFYTAPYEINREQQTVSLTTKGGEVPMTVDNVTLSATAQAAGPVFYRIVSGGEVATLEGNVLTPVWGKAGSVTVEAYSMGDGTYSSASSEPVTFTFNRVPWFEMLVTAPDTHGQPAQYVTLNTAGRPLAELALETLNEVTLSKISEVDLLGRLDNVAPNTETVLWATPEGGQDVVYRIRYRFEGDEQPAYSSCSNGANEVHYWTEVMGNERASTSCSFVPGAYVNQATDGTALRIGDNVYAKGLCMPSGANVQNTRSQNLRGYTRFKTDLGFQYGTSGYDSGTIRFIVHNEGRNLFDSQVGGAVRKFEYAIVNGSPSGSELDATKRLSFWTGAGRTTVLGGARFYREPNFRPENQTITWDDETVLQYNRPATYELSAVSSTGLPVCYTVTEGTDYARIIDGNKLEIFRVPDVDGRIVVEAFQPGSHTVNPAERVSHTYQLVHSLVVRPGERAVLDRDETLQEIVIYGNRESVGQVAVDGAMINARKITFKYTFVPGQWHHLVFPSDINLDQASDLRAKGYALNNPTPYGGGYFVQSFDTRANALNPGESPWVSIEDPVLKGRTGYVMKLSDNLGTDPVEVTFTIDNEQLNLDGGALPMMLSLDLTRMRPYTSQDVYVKALGVASNTLKVKVDFQPEDPESLPVNHEAALEDMRIVITPDASGMRLTLPNQDEARVVILDRKGKRVIKAVKYVSPFLIDISDLRNGEYQVGVRYGEATTTRTISIKR